MQSDWSLLNNWSNSGKLFNGEHRSKVIVQCVYVIDSGVNSSILGFDF